MTINLFVTYVNKDFIKKKKKKCLLCIYIIRSKIIIYNNLLLNKKTQVGTRKQANYNNILLVLFFLGIQVGRYILYGYLTFERNGGEGFMYLPYLPYLPY